MDQLRLDLAPPPHSTPRKKQVRGYLDAPFCPDCTTAGYGKRNYKCKACIRLYAAAWRNANPGRATAAVARYYERNRSNVEPSRAPTFKQRYRTDPAFREEHKAKVRKWAAEHPDTMAAKAVGDNQRRRDGYKALTHDPIVYFIRSYLTGLVKIGTTNSLASRILNLRNAHPGRLEVIGVMDGGQPREAEIHRQFRAQRYDGEWFVETAALVEFIKANAREQHPDLGGVKLEPSNGSRSKAQRRAESQDEEDSRDGGGSA